ncbi:glutamate-1-semialdehyde 2,1-aminomutase [Ruminococcus sp. OA3]|uniref:glutamate-1-semialdehyde 2,1-aminomutase n=1 Tax=Ruminococcus sp. OA3 TaxID=2914164 RepID=UPI001F054CE9|nr:glutamate-1-semialdehyde 2,1-aminomutase [Ruminococcus sp. OA3]MCH1983620.1 glutamate-1-semialdehyde 2,1-aminomutase [Ruminococcus sp. OA3]
MTRSETLFQEAVQYIPGGVNSPVRAYGSVGMTPRFIRQAEGPYVTDVDENRYIDYIGSWGPMILGHNHPSVLEAVTKTAMDGLSFGAATEIEVEMAEYICRNVPSVDMVRMVNSGTEAVMSAIRVARGYTGKNKIVKFAGCYHGHCDAMLVKAGSGVMTAGIPDSAGVPAGCTQDTLTAVYNDIESVKAIFAEFDGQVAAVIVEAVAANMGVVLPKADFLQELRSLCTEHGALLVFDEVITGFRLAFGGAQEYFGISADLVTYGKIIGAGMPVGAYGGRRDIMQQVAPVGPVYQAGTLSGNPVAMAAGLTQLKILKENPDIYSHMASMGERLFGGMRALLRSYGKEQPLNHTASLGCMYFTDQEVCNYETAKTSDTEKFADYFRFMLEHGIHLGPSQFEAMFVSNAHTEEVIDQTLDVVKQYLESRV